MSRTWRLKTIDLDVGKNLDQLRDCLNFLDLCRHARNMKIETSTNGGIHISIRCTNPLQCDVCRERYDDPRRYRLDGPRPEHGKNVLFDKKVQH